MPRLKYSFFRGGRCLASTPLQKRTMLNQKSMRGIDRLQKQEHLKREVDAWHRPLVERHLFLQGVDASHRPLAKNELFKGEVDATHRILV